MIALKTQSKIMQGQSKSNTFSHSLKHSPSTISKGTFSTKKTFSFKYNEKDLLFLALRFSFSEPSSFEEIESIKMLEQKSTAEEATEKRYAMQVLKRLDQTIV